MRIALVHDYLTQRGGAERVVMELVQALPGTPIHTSLFEPERTFPEFASMDVRPLALNRAGFLRADHRRAAPLLAPAFSFRVVDADVVVCSSSGWAHGVRTTGRKIVYCYNPARWLYQSDLYHQELPVAIRAVSRTMSPSLRRWDRWAASTANRYIAISRAVQRRIRDAYGIEAEVVHPPTSLDAGKPCEEVPGLEPGFLLCVARLLPYKKIDLVIEALDHLPAGTRLAVVGDGPDRARLKEASRSRNIELLGTVTEGQLRWLYHHCQALVTASFEDFGLTPVEAAMFGRPTVAMRWGGFLDTITEGVNGVFFDNPEPVEVAEAVRRAQRHDWDEALIRAHSEKFSRANFRERIRKIVTEE